jgi:uncharacterized protein (DUF4415 family)
MRKQYDFSKAKRGAAVSSSGKTRITIMLDDDILQYFRDLAEKEGSGYQTIINAALKQAMSKKTNKEQESLTVAKLREVLRQELKTA